MSSKIITGAAGQQLHVRKGSQDINTLVTKQISGTSRANALAAALSPEEPRCLLQDQWPQKAALEELSNSDIRINRQLILSVISLQAEKRPVGEKSSYLGPAGC